MQEFLPKYAMREENASGNKFRMPHDPDALNDLASSNSGFITLDQGMSNRGGFATDAVSSQQELPPMMVSLGDDKLKARKSKLEAIGTLLEKAVVRDPYKAPNCQQPVPHVFINQKLYGKSTLDDPANNIDLARRRARESNLWALSDDGSKDKSNESKSNGHGHGASRLNR